MFGVPLTQNTNNRNQAKDRIKTLYLLLVPPGFFFLRYERHHMIRGGRTTVHNTGQKGTTLDTDKGKQHPRCFLKRPRDNKVGGKSAPR